MPDECMQADEFRELTRQFGNAAIADAERRGWNRAINRVLLIVGSARIPERAKIWIVNQIKEAAAAPPPLRPDS